MPDTNIETTIFKLDLDGSGYIKGVEDCVASTKKLSTEQEKVNVVTEKITKENEKAAESTKKLTTEQEKEVESTKKLSAEKEKAVESTKKLSAEKEKEVESSKKLVVEQEKEVTSVKKLATEKEKIVESTKKLVVEEEKEVEVTKKVAAEQEKAVTATKKLSTEQEKASKVLADLKNQENAYRKSLDEVNAVIKANEKETLELTKQLNDLKNAGKGASAEAKNLQSALRGIATNTKEFKIEASELSKNLTNTTTQVKNQTKVVQDLDKSSVGLTKTLGGAEKATGGFTKSISGAYSGLSKVAQLIPGLGIGGLIAIIAGPLISAIQKWGSSLLNIEHALSAAARQQRVINEITNEGIKSSTGDIVRLELIKSKLEDLSIPQKQRIALAKEYNKTADEGNEIDLKQIDNIALVNNAISTQIAKIKERAFARASENIITQRTEALLLAQEQARVTNVDFAKQATAPIPGQEKGNLMAQYVEELKEKTFLAGQIAKDPAVIKAQQELDDALAAGSRFITATGLTKGGQETIKKERKAIENVYLQEKAALDLKLAEARRKEADDESKIRIEFADRLKKEKVRIQELLSDKKLTKPQANILTGEATEINTILLNKALDDIRKKAIAAREKLNAELIVLQDKNMQDSLNLIQEEFNRRSQLIDFNEQKELANSRASTDKRLAALDLERLLIGEKAYQDGKAILISAGELAALNIIEKFANQRKDLSSDIFQSLLQQYDNAVRGADLIRDEQTAKDVTALAEKFNAGKISYEQFQKDIKNIQKKADLDSKEGTLAVDRGKLQALDRQLAAIEDKYSESYKKLKKQRDDQASKVAKEETDLAKSQGEKPEADPRFARVAKYAESINQVAQAVIGFWQAANQAESNALDRSIALQEKRVDAAQRIAERGNAQYLKQEEDRLRELTIKRENAARRELGINAALQASQLLVGITGAIAKIATPGIGIAETIGAIAVIFGALATGYGLVKSLQGSQPKLAKGSKYVTRDGNPSGTDTIPALINEGEAVIPTSKNKAYHPAIAAIYDGTIPADHMNSFVNTYHKIKSVPSPNYDRLRETAEFHIGENGRMAVLLSDNNRKLDEQSDLLRTTNRTLHKLGVNVSLDANGFAVTQMEVIEQMRKNKRL